MYVCICKNVTENQIRDAVREKGIQRIRELRQTLGTCEQCGKCAPEAQQLIRDCLGQADSRADQSALRPAAVLAAARRTIAVSPANSSEERLTA
jgi:bacterioferritin-associated ferredoxin